MGLPRILRKMLPDGLVYRLELGFLYKTINSKITVEEWEQKGRPLPPPDVVKHAVLRDYAKRFGAGVLVETGTFLGDTSFAMRGAFKQIYTIELDQKLFLRAAKRFAPFPHVRVVRGDSAQVLPEILQSVPKDTICLFWLDGHYSGSVTSWGEQNTPIQKEIEAIYQHSLRHVLLVDDARLFAQEKDGYPSLQMLQQAVAKHQPNAQFVVEDDIVRITPP